MYLPRHFGMDELDVLDLLHGMGAGDLVTPTTTGLASSSSPCSSTSPSASGAPSSATSPG